MMKAVLLAVALVLLAVTPVYADTNLLQNPGFETGDFSGWNTWSSNQQIWSGWGHSGNYNAHAWYGGGAYQDFAITNPDQPLYIGGWIYQPDNDLLNGNVYAQVKVEFKNSLNEIVATEASPYLSASDLIINGWKDISTTVTPSSLGSGIVKGTAVWQVTSNGGGSGGGSANFDDMHVTAVPEPVASALFLLGGATLAVRRLRKK